MICSSVWVDGLAFSLFVRLHYLETWFSSNAFDFILWRDDQMAINSSIWTTCLRSRCGDILATSECHHIFGTFFPHFLSRRQNTPSFITNPFVSILSIWAGPISFSTNKSAPNYHCKSWSSLLQLSLLCMLLQCIAMPRSLAFWLTVLTRVWLPQ